MISARKPYLTLLEAFDIVGRKSFDDDWIGNDGGEYSESRVGWRASPEEAKAFERTHVPLPGLREVPRPDPDTKEYREQYEAWCRCKITIRNLRELMADFYVESTYREDGFDAPVEPANWDLRNELFTSDPVRDSFDPRGHGVRGELRIDRDGFLEAIAKAFPEDEGRQQKSSNRGETLCKKWLVSLMEKEGPPAMPKPDYWADANERFSISERSFKRAWRAAIVESGNTAWSKPGRKSVRRIDTPIAS